MREVTRAFEMILGNPRVWPKWLGLRSRYTIRRFVMLRFPFAIGYLITPTEIIVLAVAHARRKPGYWLSRTVPKTPSS